MIEFLVWFVAFLISTSGVTYLYCKLCDVKFRINLFIIIWLIIGSLGSAILRIFNLTLLSTLLYFLFYPVLFNALNKSRFNKQFFYTVVVWLCGIVLDIFSMFLVLFFNLFIDFNVYGYISRIILTFVLLVLFIVLGNICCFRKVVNLIYFRVQKISFFDFALISFGIFVILVGMAIFWSLDNLNLSILLFAIIILLGFSFVLLIGVRINLVENAKFLKHLKENNEFYVKIEDENRIFKHNLMAKMLSIKSVSGKEARELIDDFLNTFNSSMDFSIHVKDIPYGLNGIIYEKIYPYIGQLNIKIDNKIDFDIFSKLKPRRYNVFVEKMFIALDNAIQACLKSYSKILILNLYYEDNQIIMDIKNTFEANLNLDDLGTINYSTKGKRRGLGLFSALRDNEVCLSIKIINDLFVTKVVAKQNLNEEK